MSMQQKLQAAAGAAALEAMTNERGRALWCLDQVLTELRAKVNQKLLSHVQLEAAKMKLKIAEAVCMELRRAIVSGVRPSRAVSARGEPAEAAQGGQRGGTGAADSSSLERSDA